jgi:hypothetical protein
MTAQAIIGYFVGAVVIIPTGALIAKYATVWIAGFRPRFTKALLSTVIAYVAANLLGLLFQFLPTMADISRGLQFLVGWGVLSCCHANLLRSETGQHLSPGKAVLVALCQIVGAIVIFLLVLLLMLGIKRLLG